MHVKLRAMNMPKNTFRVEIFVHPCNFLRGVAEARLTGPGAIRSVPVEVVVVDSRLAQRSADLERGWRESWREGVGKVLSNVGRRRCLE